MNQGNIRIQPHLLVFEKENTENAYPTFEDKMKPSIELEDGILQEEYEKLKNRRDQILQKIEEIVVREYLDGTNEDRLSEIGAFPDIRFFTGNYYVEYESYGYHFRGKNGIAYHIKNNQFRHVYYTNGERKETYLPLDSDEITKYYCIIISVRLTSDETGSEEDYMGLDLIAELLTLDAPIEFEILSHDAI